MDPNALELTVEQEFEIRRIQQEMQNISQEQAHNLLLQVSKLLMVKDNLIKDLMKKASL